MRVLGIDHVVLRVRDPERAMRFYVDVLGCSVERRQDALGLVQLRVGASLIDLVDVAGKIGRQGGAPPGAQGHNMDHLCLRIEPWDEAALLAHLRAHAVQVGEIGQRYGAEGEGPSIYIHDCEGNQLELKGPPSTGPRVP